MVSPAPLQAWPGSFSTWTVADMIMKVRNITGTPGIDQLTQLQIAGYLNQVYVYVQPFELKEMIEDQFLDFKTTPGVDVYSFPGGYFTDQPGAYADGFPLIFYQDPDIFYQDWPQQYAVDNLFSFNGVQTTFTGGLQNPPVIIGTTFISMVDNSTNPVPTVIAEDQGDGTLSGSGVTGTINYLSGAISVTYATAPPSTATIYGKYQGYQGNRPQGVMFFNNEFTLRPVPDQVYAIRMQGYVKPVNFATDDEVALQAEWGAYLAYAAALEIFSDRGDMENYNRYYPIFKRYENIALGRTIQQLTAEQSVGRF